VTTVLASAADERYGFHLLSLLGSVQRNSDLFDRIVVFDLGLSPLQRLLVDAIRGVEVRTVPPFVSHWAQGFTWKTWIWTHVDADRIFYLDAGTMVLRSLRPALDQIGERGYFVVSQGFSVHAIVPDDWFELYGLDAVAAERDSVAAGIIGFETRGSFWERVVLPTYEDCLAGRSLGFSAGDVERLNYGLGRTESAQLRDCEHFRWDQSVLNAHFLKAYPDAYINDVYRFGGWRSPIEHPEQLIWHHRRRGDYRYLGRARYSPLAAVRARLLAARLRTRRWHRANRRFFQPSAYLRKSGQVLGAHAAQVSRAWRRARG
jgi:hypothetical protein